MYPSIKVIDPAFNAVKEIKQFLKTNNNLAAKKNKG